MGGLVVAALLVFAPVATEGPMKGREVLALGALALFAAIFCQMVLGLGALADQYMPKLIVVPVITAVATVLTARLSLFEP